MEIDGSGLRGRARRFPAVQHRSAGQFALIHSRDTTVVDRCSCFMCGKQFSKRQHLKRHFSACAKENYMENRKCYKADAANVEDNDHICKLTENPRKQSEIQDFIPGNEPGIQSRKYVCVKDNNKGYFTHEHINVTTRDKQRDANIPYAHLDDQCHLENKTSMKQSDSKNNNAGFISDNPDKTVTKEATHVENHDTKITVDRKRSRETDTNVGQFDIHVHDSKKLKTENDISYKLNDRNRKKLTTVSNFKIFSKTADKFSSIFGCTLCGASFSNQIAMLNHHRKHMDNIGYSYADASHRDFAKVYDRSMFDQDRSGVLEKQIKLDTKLSDKLTTRIVRPETTTDHNETGKCQNVYNANMNLQDILYDDGATGDNICVDQTEPKKHRHDFKVKIYEQNALATKITHRVKDDATSFHDIEGIGTKEYRRDYHINDKRTGSKHDGNKKKTYEGTPYEVDKSDTRNYPFKTYMEIRNQRKKRTVMDKNLKDKDNRKHPIDMQGHEQMTNESVNMFENIDVAEVMLYLRRNLTTISTP